MGWKVDKYDNILGVWGTDNRPIGFRRVWSNHIFTDSELDDLFDGKTITITTTSNKTGREFTADVRIEKDVEFRGIVKDRIQIVDNNKPKSSTNTTPSTTSSTTPSNESSAANNTVENNNTSTVTSANSPATPSDNPFRATRKSTEPEPTTKQTNDISSFPTTFLNPSNVYRGHEFTTDELDILAHKGIVIFFDDNDKKVSIQYKRAGSGIEICEVNA